MDWQRRSRKQRISHPARPSVLAGDTSGHFTSLSGGSGAASRREPGGAHVAGRSWISSIPLTGRAPSSSRGGGARRDYEMVSFENRYRARGGGWRWLRWSARSDGEAWFAVASTSPSEKEMEGARRVLLTDEHLVAYSQPILDYEARRPGGAGRPSARLLRRGRRHLPGGFLPEVERCGLIGSVDNGWSRRAWRSRARPAGRR